MRRTEPMSPGWEKLRLAILERDGYSCTWVDRGIRCNAHATDVDHIEGHDDDPSNLRALCKPHHAKRTSRQALAVRWARDSTRRPVERHPGLR